MKITREWATPNSNTFSIKPINELISLLFVRTMLLSGHIIDPFCHKSPFKDRCISNDLDKRVAADYHLDALDFLKLRKDGDTKLVLFDPPYLPRQASFWSNLKAEISRVVCNNGIVVTCGRNSGGIGKKYGFKITGILIVSHGGWHNDTIVTVEKKQKGE